MTVPRELLANFGPKDPVHVPQFITFDEFDGMFSTVAHSAWRLESRRRYASDEATDTVLRYCQVRETAWHHATTP